MANSLNKVMLIGHLGDEVKMHYFEGGNCIGRFPVATNESKRYTTEIHALEMTFLTTKKDLNNPGPAGQEPNEAKSTGAKPIEGTADDLPF